MISLFLLLLFSSSSLAFRTIQLNETLVFTNLHPIPGFNHSFGNNKNVTVTRLANGRYRGLAILDDNSVIEFDENGPSNKGKEDGLELPFGCGNNESTTPGNDSSFLRQLEEEEEGGEGLIPFTPGCYPLDQKTHFLKFGVVLDQGVDIAQAEMALAGTRLLLRRQLNIQLEIDEIIQWGKSAPPCSRDYSSRLEEFTQFTTTIGEKPLWHLITNCWPPPGTVGTAYLRTLCHPGRNTGITSLVGSSTFAILLHEVGHGLGATHSFEYGMGRTGGLMDYGNYLFQGVAQFHPLKREEICSTLTDAHCPPELFGPLIEEGEEGGDCGNMILEEGEQCECLNASPECDGCLECQLTAPLTECSTSTFVIGDGGKELKAVSPSLLSSPECCQEGKLMNAQTSCPRDGVCHNGKCLLLCAKYGLYSCPVTENGCRQPCGPDCLDSLQTQISKVMISYLPDGSRCGGRESEGTCAAGLCSSSPPPLPPCPFFRIRNCPKLSKSSCISSPIWKHRCSFCDNKCRAKTPGGCRDSREYYSHC
jgi:hypothetical protein